jgi:hypothetical protein
MSGLVNNNNNNNSNKKKQKKQIEMGVYVMRRRVGAVLTQQQRNVRDDRNKERKHNYE